MGVAVDMHVLPKMSGCFACRAFFFVDRDSSFAVLFSPIDLLAVVAYHLIDTEHLRPPCDPIQSSLALPSLVLIVDSCLVSCVGRLYRA